MNRKQFVQALGLLLGTVPILTATSQTTAARLPGACVQPPFLFPGSVIGITATSGAVSTDAISAGIQLVRSWGYQVKLGRTIGTRNGYFSGTDEERAADLQDLLDDPQVNAIWCARGGYGLVRIIDQLDWTGFRKHPKWIIGFSDVTVLHCQLHRMGFASIHGQMLAEANTGFVQTKQVLEGRPPLYQTAPLAANKTGIGEGLLVGGNLKLLETQAGTPTDLDTRGKILFIEDVNETLYNIDRMLCNLKRSGKLAELAGLIVGGFGLAKGETAANFGRSVSDMVLEHTSGYAYPVCFDFAVGHQPANWPLKCGVPHKLEVTGRIVRLVELNDAQPANQVVLVRGND
ncbi:muramoyltetrapeptide carboxypeptidase [Cnuella takakiae]|uniref:Muramoyltetrapeptide carboxypeptidase n=1 Tax=Cnuella takakiae TaxID=1302690 RepID=A0A1M4WEJ7_9BACT|nr:LD-carboxypeptidase [Cnuella takakiae]OLY91740.1 hypothetical protein BUE76_07380 [Cnuella takakiae]SHE79634.1 muramoyltetrapeptide carboxypeptidase [Cnuella takakiae]